MKRPCLECGVLAEGSRCPAHQARRDAQRSAWYGGDWERYARALIAAEPWCHVCGASGLKLVAGHIGPARRGGRAARPVCSSCNAREA